jgi:hypothetical protein
VTSGPARYTMRSICFKETGAVLQVAQVMILDRNLVYTAQYVVRIRADVVLDTIILTHVENNMSNL